MLKHVESERKKGERHLMAQSVQHSTLDYLLRSWSQDGGINARKKDFKKKEIKNSVHFWR